MRDISNQRRHRSRDLVNIDGEKLKEILYSKHIPLQELSRWLGYHDGYLRDACRRGRLSRKVIQRLLDISIDVRDCESAEMPIKQPPSDKELLEWMEALGTQGYKECRASRINMAFTPSNHDFLRIMARLKGQTITEFCNFVIERYRLEYGEIYEQVKEFINALDEEGHDD